MTRKSALAVAIAALLTPAVAGALGIGDIQVNSALNEPLQARIPVRGASAEDFGNLRARLGSLEQFERAGFERPFVLTKLRFKVVETSGTKGYIEVSSKGPVAEPFLNFLLDVTWLNGHVVREYTLLLDPPVYGAAINRATQKQVATVSNQAAAVIKSPVPAPKNQTTVANAPTRSQTGTTTASGSVGSYGPVKDGETLWSIATTVRPTTTVSIQAMMLAILKANPEAFTIDNVNALRTGSVLRIPAASELRMNKADALAEVANQHGLWLEYRQAIGAPVAEPTLAGQVASKAAVAEPPAGTDTSAVNAGSGGGELKLVVADKSKGSGAGSGEELQTLNHELSLAREQADTAKNENEDLKNRLQKVESIVTDLNRLVDLKEEQLAALQAQLAKQQTAEESIKVEPKPVINPQPVAATKTKPKEAVAEPAKEKKKAKVPARPVITPPAPKSFMDDINDLLPVPLWTLLAGLGALLVGLVGAGVIRKRRAGGKIEDNQTQLTAGESMISQYAESDADDLLDGDATTEVPNVAAAASLGSDDATVVAESADDISADVTELPAGHTESTGKIEAVEPASTEDDPLAEFNVYLAYESFEQAEQLARNAIAGAPDRHDYKAKLLEVFYASKNLQAYETAAKVLQDAVGEDHASMVQARDWWSDLGTGRELFSAGGDAATEAADDVFDVTSLGAAGAGDETGLDFDLGAGSEKADGADDGDSGLDFDLGSLGDTGALSDAAGGESNSDGTGLDFDLGGLGDADPVSSSSESSTDSAATGLDFDLGGLGTDSLADNTPADTGSDLDFDLGGLDDSPEGVSGDASTGIQENADAGGLDFDLGGMDSADSSAATQIAADEGVDSGLDFDLGDTGSGVTVDDAVTEVNEEVSLDPGLGKDALEAIEPGNEVAVDTEGNDTEMALDFDLSDTMTVGDAPSTSNIEDLGQALSDVTEDDGGLEFDMDLGSTNGEGELQLDATEAASEEGLDLDLGLGSTGGEGELQLDTAEAASEEGLDLDLGSTGGEGELQLDTAETSSEEGLELDMDLGSTGGEDELQLGTAEAASEEGLDLDLDMDLGSTGGEGELQLDTAEAASEEGLDLDMDLGSTDGEGELQLDAAEAASEEELDLSLDMDLESTAGESVAEGEGAATNTELPGLGDVEPDFQDAETVVGDISDSALMAELGIDIPDPGKATSIDTVKLAADDVANLSLGKSTDLDFDLESDGGETEFGVDTEFKDIFAVDGVTESDTSAESVIDFDLGSDLSDAGVGAGSSVDFDLGADFESADADSAQINDIEAAADGDDDEAEEDLDVTVFSLPKLRKPLGTDTGDDEDKTLVLGRSSGTGSVDDMQTKLDLAQAYMETGDTEGARNLLGEVMAEGSELQQATAREMLTKLT